jgi:hypothetical protein
MRLLSRLEYERSFGASRPNYFVRIPMGSQGRVDFCGIVSCPSVMGMTSVAYSAAAFIGDSRYSQYIDYISFFSLGWVQRLR